MEIGEKIKTLRKEKNMTQTELAEKIGVFGSGTISQFESGFTKPGRDALIKIAEALGVTVNDLVY